eukprot:Gb_24268 [translate_table: standard]
MRNHKIFGTTVKWKDGMNVTNGISLYKEGNHRSFQEESFFPRFSETQQKNPSDGIHDEVAEVIKEDLWSNPLKYFNNEADEEDYEDGEDEDNDGENENMITDPAYDSQAIAKGEATAWLLWSYTIAKKSIKCERKHVDGRSTNEGIRNYNYEEVEVLEEEIEEESLVLREACRIKEILANLEGSTSVVYESLRRMELMQLSVQILKSTKVGKQVNILRRHTSKEIQSMVKMLINSLKKMTKLSVSSFKIKSRDDAVKLETAKRRLQERYRQAEDAKKKLTALMIDLKDLPKQKSNLRRR